MVLSDASTEESLAAIAARRAVMLASRAVAANRAHVAVAVDVRHPQQLQVLHVVHHRRR